MIENRAGNLLLWAARLMSLGEPARKLLCALQETSHAALCEQETFQVGAFFAWFARLLRWPGRALGKLAATFPFFRHLSHVRVAIGGVP
ncbi:MAG TPA: hypothetical protein VEN30_21305 [Paraburkholderia sp.]|nr:hypothetical protein [Paraburkholderia sp.]